MYNYTIIPLYSHCIIVLGVVNYIPIINKSSLMLKNPTQSGEKVHHTSVFMVKAPFSPGQTMVNNVFSWSNHGKQRFLMVKPW